MSSSVISVPNALTFLRFLGIPLFIYLTLSLEADGWAIVVLAIGGATDYFDGKIARAWNQTSRFGELADPAIDRLYILATLIVFFDPRHSSGMDDRDHHRQRCNPCHHHNHHEPSGYPTVHSDIFRQGCNFQPLVRLPIPFACSIRWHMGEHRLCRGVEFCYLGYCPLHFDRYQLRTRRFFADSRKPCHQFLMSCHTPRNMNG